MSALAPKPAVISQPRPRKPSLKEQPSYLKEVSVALSRREELLKLRERMSSARIILDADPSAKPWLLSRSLSTNSIKDEISVPTTRVRKMSRDSRSSQDMEESSEISED
eukprot:GFUD01017707.1.p1 GENE.GFUD01017707.1~~GFUD01017707.1.p1  ORF type:complete len:109 (-),score=40.49 GFUD01017707.1:416-742(-)